MNAAQLERLQEQCARLRLIKSRERLEALLQEASTQELPYADFLDRLLAEEVGRGGCARHRDRPCPPPQGAGFGSKLLGVTEQPPPFRGGVAEPGPVG